MSETTLLDCSHQEFLDHVERWRKSRSENIQSFVGLPMTDTHTMAPLIQGLLDDVGKLFTLVEILIQRDAQGSIDTNVGIVPLSPSPDGDLSRYSAPWL